MRIKEVSPIKDLAVNDLVILPEYNKDHLGIITFVGNEIFVVLRLPPLVSGMIEIPFKEHQEVPYGFQIISQSKTEEYKKALEDFKERKGRFSDQ